VLELFTFDMDIAAVWRNQPKPTIADVSDSDSESAADRGESHRSKRDFSSKNSSSRRPVLQKGNRRRNILNGFWDGASDELNDSNLGSLGSAVNGNQDKRENEADGGPPELILPVGPALYNANVWVSKQMKQIRVKFYDGIFFQTFNSGLQAFYLRDWETAAQCFSTILSNFEDGPSRYFYNQVWDAEKSALRKPPRSFRGYGIA
jgi:hypothetical protein